MSPSLTMTSSWDDEFQDRHYYRCHRPYPLSYLARSRVVVTVSIVNPRPISYDFCTGDTRSKLASRHRDQPHLAATMSRCQWSLYHPPPFAAHRFASR